MGKGKRHSIRSSGNGRSVTGLGLAAFFKVVSYTLPPLCFRVVKLLAQDHSA